MTANIAEPEVYAQRVDSGDWESTTAEGDHPNDALWQIRDGGMGAARINITMRVTGLDG